MSIKATEEQLNKIFNLTNYQFEIPSYQRPYAWTKDEVLELIDDLCDAFPYPLENDNPDYFFGSIILIKENGKSNAEVIDGSWDDWQKYGFIAGGCGRWYSKTLKNLSIGDRFFVNYCGSGYVGVGIVEETVVPVKDFQVEINGKKIPIWEASIKSKNIDHDIDDLDLCEYFVKVKWLKILPKNEAYWEKGMFAIQHTYCRLRHQETLEKLYQHFNLIGR